MSRAPRGLSDAERAAWASLAATVDPLRAPPAEPAATAAPRATTPHPAPVPAPKPVQAPPRPRVQPRALPAGRNPPDNLDSHWDRRLRAGEIAPDLSLDLHGHGLDAAYHRLMDGMAQAKAMDARTVLLVTGKSRPVDPADRGTRRGAIRAKVLDWLAASEHGGAIAAIRPAHRRHGGEGALYLVLRRRG